jgi:hypothetical protein
VCYGKNGLKIPEERETKTKQFNEASESPNDKKTPLAVVTTERL